MNSEEINISAYQYIEQLMPKLKSIYNPIIKLNIKTFAYFKFFNNGRYLYLCNDLNWVKFCLFNVHNNEGTSLVHEISNVKKDDYHCFLWPIQKIDYLMSALYDFNIWNGLSIFKKTGDIIELWGFAADRQTENMQNFYIENIELLKSFAASFTLRTSDLIVSTNSNLAIYKDFKPLTNIDDYDRREIDAFIKATPIDKSPLITEKGEVFVSKKELQCINFLVNGKIPKQIASTLGISTRTVEKHLENIKHKINGSKEDIIRVYKNSVLNWL